MPVDFTAEVLSHLENHARVHAPEEACGLLSRASGAANAATIDGFDPIPNTARSASRFAMDPITILRTLRRYRATGRELAAVFHSHPDAPARPSAADLASARAWPGVLQVIRGRDGELGVFDADGNAQEAGR